MIDKVENDNFILDESNNDYYYDENSMLKENSTDLSESFNNDNESSFNGGSDGDEDRDDDNDEDNNPYKNIEINNRVNNNNNKQNKENKDNKNSKNIITQKKIIHLIYLQIKKLKEITII